MAVTDQSQQQLRHGKTIPADDLIAVISDYAELRPSAPALLGQSGEIISYGELHKTLLDIIAQLRGAGVQAHARVAVATDPDLPGALLSLAVLGSTVCVPVSGAWSPGELGDYLELVGPRVVVAAGSRARRVTDAAHALSLPAFELDLSSGRPVMRAVPPPDGRDGPAAPPQGRLSTTPDDGLLLRTSGTTAAGKVVPIAITQALAAARATVRAYQLGPTDRRLNAMPLYHVQGLVGSLVASICAGGSIVLLPNFDARMVLQALDSFAPTWFSGTPTMHRALLDAMPDGFDVPSSLRFVRCGSGALPESLRAEMSQRWRVPIVESYGMSEAHQIASTPLPPAVASGMVASGSVVGILGEDGVIRTMPGGEPGELVVSGDNVISHYAWPPGQETAFVDGWLRTGDLGQLAPDGSVQVTGRIKELINSGGEKFSPAEVETAIAAHPAVQDVVAFAIPDPRYGERAAAVVVPRPGHTLAEEDLLSFVARRIAAAKVPRRIVQMGAIPVGKSGKVVRSELAKQVAADLAHADELARAVTGARPRNTIEATLTGLWATALERAVVPVEGDFIALGGDSLSAVALLSMVNEIFGVEISPSLLFDEISTIAAMARWIEKARAKEHPAASATAGA